MNIFIIVPAYNEGSVINKNILEIKKYFNNIIVVNDGSTDNTKEEASSSKAIVLNHIINRGQGASLRTGINYALKSGADIIVTFDADGQFNPEEISYLIAELNNGNYDIILGSRFKGSSNAPFLKQQVLFLGTLFTRAITGLKISDTHNGFRVMNRKSAELIKIRQDRMAHSSEILHQISKLKLKYKEMPVTVKYTEYSKHKGQKISGVFKIFFDLIFK